MPSRHQSAVQTPVNPANPAAKDAAQGTVQASFQEGYWQGRDRATRDYATAAAQQSASRDSATTLLGILVGMAISTLIGGTIVASFYFDGRLNSIADETETLTETLREASETEEPSEVIDGKTTDVREGGRELESRDIPQGVGADSSSRFGSGEAPPMDRLEPIAPQQPAEPFVPPSQSGNSASDRTVEPEVSDSGEDDSQTDPTPELSE